MMSDTATTPISLVLASASPRRHALLGQMGVDFSVQAADIDETCGLGELPVAYVKRMAQEKAQHVIRQLQQSGSDPVVLGADTIVLVRDEILGKPGNQQDALRMLQLLSGRAHDVFSAVAVGRNGRLETALSQTRVFFRRLTKSEMLTYWHSGEPDGKAGAYAIQGLGGMFVERMEGSYTGVVGLPVFETAALLQMFGVPTGLQSGAVLLREQTDE